MTEPTKEEAEFENRTEQRRTNTPGGFRWNKETAKFDIPKTGLFLERGEGMEEVTRLVLHDCKSFLWIEADTENEKGIQVPSEGFLKVRD